MEIVKRNGSREPVKLEKIVKSVAKTIGHIANVDPMLIATKTISGLHDGATTTSIDYLSVQEAIGFISVEPNYSAAGAALLGNIITKEVLEHGVESFSQSIALGHSLGLINDRMAKVVKQNARKLNAAIDNSKNHNFEYFGLKTVHDRYLLRHPEKRSVIETPQYWYMRIAVGLFSDNIQEALEYYTEVLSAHEFTNATPTMFNTGTAHEQLSSCYLLDSPKDDLRDIYKRYSDIALLSKFAGGIGVDWTSVRSEGSLIKGTNGLSSGIVPFLKTLDSSVRSVNQGGKRPGAAAVYLETWHSDINDFLKLRDNDTPDHSRRTFNLNLANWIPDLFMQRVDSEGMWSLFSPDDEDVKALTKLYDAPENDYAFTKAYLALEAKYEGKKGVKKIRARELYARMMKTLQETGNGWMTFKDASNRNSAQVTPQNGRIVRSSNLCFTGDTLVFVEGGATVAEFGADLFAEQTYSNEEQFDNYAYKTIAELAELSKGTKKFLVYGATPRSADQADDEIYGTSAWVNTGRLLATAFKTGTSKVIKITLDTGDSFKCTPDHELAKYDGGYVKAKHSFGISLLPFARSMTDTDGPTVVSIEDAGIEDVYDLNVPQTSNFVIAVGTNKKQISDPDFRRNCIVVHNCTEVLLTTNEEETAVCNLGSLNLGRFVVNGVVDWAKLAKRTRQAIRGLDRVIDINYYPIPEAENSNKKWRPVGLGIMGLHDVFFKLKLPFDSPEAHKLSTELQAWIFYHAELASVELAEQFGRFPAFDESRYARGWLHIDTALGKQVDSAGQQSVTAGSNLVTEVNGVKLDWEALRESIKTKGIRNSQVSCIAPTATTASILSASECVEPIVSNIFKRETLSGEFVIVNKYLVNDLRELGLWNDDIADRIKAAEGSIQGILEIPERLRNLYKTAWEYSQRVLIDMNADRQPYVDMGISLNLFMENPNPGKMSSMYMHAWKRGSKTTYYLRSRSATKIAKATTKSYSAVESVVCSLENPSACEACQ